MRLLVKNLIGMVAIVLFCAIQPAFAQGQMPAIPVDQNVRIGQLENGLTYYIRHNALPENRVEFYIAQKVGSIQEEPEQRGLAHFLEHMCFNGTKNFPGDERGLGIVQWCESKGIKFGANLNAYTSVDETVYNISGVPADNEAVLDSCLLILHDWSSAVLLQDKEIDKERGVIHEEWRSRNSGIMRIITEACPTLYVDSKYTDCMPIGSIDVIDNFPYQAIRDYYHKWYRPDLQGIIIVGDIDVDAMEAKIKKTFADVAKPVNAAERIYYPVPDNKEPLIYVGKDKEVDQPTIMIFFKQEATPDAQKGNMMYLLQNYITSMACSMLNERFGELRESANPPFLYASSDYSTYFLAKTKDAFQISASSKAEGIETALKSVLAEVERMRRFGFTESEYERARAKYLQNLESAYNEREKTKSDAYVNDYVRHFLDAEPIPGIEFEYSTMNQLAPNIPVAVINQAIQQMLAKEENQAVFIGGTDNEQTILPSNETVLAALKGMRALDLKPYEDKVSDEPLMKEIPQGGSIVSEKQDAIFGTTELTLSNGIKVYLKPTDFKADEIRMSARSFGGSSMFEDKEALDFSMMTSIISAGGIGNHSQTDLRKLLAGKKVSVNASVQDVMEGISGFCAPKDFETFMQLTYLTFTSPRKDEEAFTSYKNRIKAQLESAKANPLSSFNDSVMDVLYNNHPRAISIQPESLEKLNYDRIIEMYKERFADGDDFVFFFIGNIDMDKMKPLIAQYIGALPTLPGKENFVDRKMNIVKGNVVKEYAKAQETPMATVAMVHSADFAYNLKNVILTDYLSQILRQLYTEEVREKEGGTYGVQCSGAMSKNPNEQLLIEIVYQTDPAKKDHLNKVIDAQLEKLATEGPKEEQMQKVKEYMLKKYNDNQKENGYWLGCLIESYNNGMDKNTGYDKLVEGITAKDIQLFAAEILKQGNKATVIMTVPE